MYVGQQKPSDPSACMQNNVRSISVGSCGTTPWTSRNSFAGNQAGSVSSIIGMPKSLEIWILTCKLIKIMNSLQQQQQKWKKCDRILDSILKWSKRSFTFNNHSKNEI